MLQLDDSSISVIGKCLPPWFSTSKSGMCNSYTTLKNLKFCSEWIKEISPINPLEKPCCLRHLIQKYFYANPVGLGKLWEAAELSLEGLMSKQVCVALLPHLEHVGWASCIDLPVVCDARNTERPALGVCQESLSSDLNSGKVSKKLNVNAAPFHPPPPVPEPTMTGA